MLQIVFSIVMRKNVNVQCIKFIVRYVCYILFLFPPSQTMESYWLAAPWSKGANLWFSAFVSYLYEFVPLNWKCCSGVRQFPNPTLFGVKRLTSSYKSTCVYIVFICILYDGCRSRRKYEKINYEIQTILKLWWKFSKTFWTSNLFSSGWVAFSSHTLLSFLNSRWNIFSYFFFFCCYFCQIRSDMG